MGAQQPGPRGLGVQVDDPLLEDRGHQRLEHPARAGDAQARQPAPSSVENGVSGPELLGVVVGTQFGGDVVDELVGARAPRVDFQVVEAVLPDPVGDRPGRGQRRPPQAVGLLAVGGIVPSAGRASMIFSRLICGLFSPD